MERSFWIATVATAIPPTLFAIASVVLTLLNPELLKTEGLNRVDICLQISLGLLFIAFISLIILAIRHRRQIAAGMASGFGIGFVVWLVAFIVVSLIYDFWL